MPEESPKAVPNRPASRFGLGLLLYVWILLILGGALLFVLQDYLSAYEASQAKYCVRHYEDTLHAAPTEAARRALAGMDPRILGSEDRDAWLAEHLGDAVLVKDHARSRDTEQIYFIRSAAGDTLGNVVFAPMSRTRYNLPLWAVAEEQFDFSSFFRQEEITVPPEYQVFLGACPLGPECIVQSRIPYGDLTECYPSYADLPTLVRYRTPPFVGDPALRVLDGEGRELAPEELSEDAYLDRCSDEVRRQAEAFLGDFVELYVRYSANIDGSYLYYFFRLRTLVRTDGPLDKRLVQSLDGIGFSHTRELHVASVTLNRIADLGRNRYLADVSYVTDIRYRWGETRTEEHVQLMLLDENGSLLADALYFR